MVYKGQYLLLKEQRPDLPDYQVISFFDGWCLYVHQELPVFYDKERAIALLGIAWQVIPERESPQQEIMKLVPGADGEFKEEQILEMEGSWCGRYVLICRNRIFTDACGQLNVFYSSEGICSSLFLLAGLLGQKECIYTPDDVMNWMPGPLTQYEQIRRLLPDQVYDYTKEEITVKQMLCPVWNQKMEEDTRIRMFTDCFCSSLQNMQRTMPDRQYYLALTGGYDSRTLFALACRANLSFTAYSLEHEKMLQGDIDLPRILCEKTGKPFCWIKRNKQNYSREREEEYYRYTAGLVKDEDRVFYAYHQYQTLLEGEKNCVLLRSAVWESVIEYFGRLFDRTSPNKEFYKTFVLEENSLAFRSIKAYMDWCEKNPLDGLCAADRFYWEQREGCWLSSMEQGFELLEDTVSLQPLNSRYLLSLLMGFSREDRIKKEHQVKIISYACPSIEDVPFANEKIHGETAAAAAINKGKKLLDRLKKDGLAETVKTYVSIFRNRSKR